MPATVRTVSTAITFAGIDLMTATTIPPVEGVAGAPIGVLSARGEVTADRGWPTCSVFVTARPYHPPDDLLHPGEPIGEENELVVIAGAGNNVTRFTGRVRRFRPSGFPKGVEIVSTGTLAYAEEWAPDKDFRYTFTEDGPTWYAMFSPDGATDQQLIRFALDHVPGVTYDAGDIAGSGLILGIAPGANTAFDWKAGMTAWRYIENIDRATLYRTYQTREGIIRRVKMVGHPNNTPDFGLGPEDVLDGATGSRNTEQTRNAVEVRGYNYGGNNQMLGTAYQSNSFQGDGSDPAQRHVEIFASDMIQSGHNVLGDTMDFGGLNADAIAAEVILDVNKEFVEAQVSSWRDDTHGPGLTCLLDMLDRLAIGEPMWVARHAWEVGDNGWQATYGMTGGGLPQTYTPPDV